MCVVIILALVSLKTIVQDIQLISYKNKVEGTVSVAEFEGERWEYNTVGNGQSHIFDHVHFVITFDHETAGYRQYEYQAKNIIISPKYAGDRYLVAFNNIENPILILKSDIAVEHMVLLLFSVLVVTVMIFRNRLWTWLTKIIKEVEADI